MKTFLRGLLIGLLLFSFTTVNFAQEDLEAIKKELYEVKFKSNRNGNADQKKVAAEAAKEFIRRFENDESVKAITDFLKNWLVKYEKQVAEDAIFAKFDSSMMAKPKIVADAFSSGKQIIDIYPDDIDFMIVLALLGYDEALAKRDGYNNETLRYAKTVIEKIEAGKPSISGNYGFFDGYTLKTKTYTDGKSNTLGWMNLIVGFILERQNNRKEALPYYYKATQIKNSEVGKKTDALIPIAYWYRDEFNRLADELKVKYEAIKPEVENDETKKLAALQRGYAERALDAYGRVYNIVKTGTNKAFADSLKKAIDAFYKARFNKTVGSDAYLTTALNGPLPNPSTEVTPVAEEVVTTPDPKTTPKPTGETKTTTTTSTTTGNTTPKPGATTPKTTPNGATATPKPKKPAPKKKGTK